MKNFAPLQITALAVLSVIVIALAIAAFATGNSLATETVEVAAAHTTPQIIEIRLADNTNMPTPVPIPAPTPTPEATEAPTSTPTRAPKNGGDGIFTLEIKDNTISVAYGVEEKTLDKTPGWLTTSVLPGEDGMCVVYGHRNRNHLKVLEDVKRGDTITVTMDSGTVYTYTVSDITIYEKTADLSLPVMDGKTLVLVTCYPFRYSGHAPGKYVVTAQFID